MARSTHHTDYRMFLVLLRGARDSADVTQVELADRLRTTQSFISKVERGERRIDIVEAIEICEAIGVDPRSLVDRYLEKRAGLRRSVTPSAKVSKRDR